MEMDLLTKDEKKIREKAYLMLVDLQTRGDEHSIIAMAEIIGLYYSAINSEYNYMPIYPKEYLPLSKPEIKDWGFKWAALLAKKQGDLKRYQQDLILCYTEFRDITPTQWEAMKGMAWSLTAYGHTLRSKGREGVQGELERDIPTEYRRIIDESCKEYKAEESELHNYLTALSKRSSGCASMMAVVIIIVGSYLFFRYLMG